MSETARENASTTPNDSQGFSGTSKPFVQRVVLLNGKVRLFGVADAARWLGVTPASLSALARGVNGIPITWEARARAEFPELFEPQTNS